MDEEWITEESGDEGAGSIVHWGEKGGDIYRKGPDGKWYPSCIGCGKNANDGEGEGRGGYMRRIIVGGDSWNGGPRSNKPDALFVKGYIPKPGLLVEKDGNLNIKILPTENDIHSQLWDINRLQEAWVHRKIDIITEVAPALFDFYFNIGEPMGPDGVSQNPLVFTLQALYTISKRAQTDPAIKNSTQKLNENAKKNKQATEDIINRDYNQDLIDWCIEKQFGR